MSTPLQPGAPRVHQGAPAPAAKPDGRPCPCGCGLWLAEPQASRRLVCAALWFTLPVSVRALFQAGRPEDRRAASKLILEAALDAKRERQRTLPPRHQGINE